MPPRRRRHAVVPSALHGWPHHPCAVFFRPPLRGQARSVPSLRLPYVTDRGVHVRYSTMRRVLTTALTVGVLGLLPSTALAHESYEVQRGDTLSEIADQFELPDGAWRAIARDNPDAIDDPDLIVPGLQLQVPTTPAGLDLDSLPPVGGTTPADDAAPATSESSTQSSESTSADGSTWERLAQCESGGDWSHDGQFDGGLQFHPDTWTAFGGDEYAPYAHQASKSQQIAIAERVLAQQGWDAWPACSSSLGLR